MPIYRYRAKDTSQCEVCTEGFDVHQRLDDKVVAKCPECGAAVEKMFVPFSCGASKGKLDDQAKNAGFQKLKRKDKGVYERLY